MLVRQPTYDATHANNDVCNVGHVDVSQLILMRGYARVLTILVKPKGYEGKSSIVGYVAFRKRDGHKDLFVIDHDGIAHKSDMVLPQCKKTSIPVLASLLDISRDSVVTLKDTSVQRKMNVRSNAREIRASAPHMERIAYVHYGKPVVAA